MSEQSNESAALAASQAQPTGADTAGQPQQPETQDASYWQAEAKKAFEARDKERAIRKDYESNAQKSMAEEKSRLMESGKLQETISLLEKQIEDLQPKANAHDDIQAVFSAQLEAQREALPEKFREAIPQGLKPLDEMNLVRAYQETLNTQTPEPQKPALPPVPAGNGQGEVQLDAVAQQLNSMTDPSARQAIIRSLNQDQLKKLAGVLRS